ncbi:hypothetical protein AAHA92_02865 [Salvia divinorum]|uniref:Uncharacterized protein n=1 Tax=Salvia divinorum TaxID=28513 RepID=A0ABD1IG30_SALDI
MGSCLGTNSAAAHCDGGSKSPPPVYELTVKEVLSETPAAPKHPIPRFHARETMLHQNGAASKNAFGASNSDSPDGELRRPSRDGRQFSGEVKREKMGAVSPARKSDADTSPCRAKPVRNKGGRWRSRSPVTRSDSGSSKTGLDTSKSPMKMGYHPGRVEYGSGDRIRKGKEEEVMPPTNIELLESSLVSLECFIFL